MKFTIILLQNSYEFYRTNIFSSIVLVYAENDFIPRKIDYSNGSDASGSSKSPASEFSDYGSATTSSWAEDTMRRCCSKKVLYKRIPILNLFGSYRKEMIVSDLVAGITVGMTMVPQAIAYANVAGLPPKVRFILLSNFQNDVAIVEMISLVLHVR